MRLTIKTKQVAGVTSITPPRTGDAGLGD